MKISGLSMGIIVIILGLFLVFAIPELIAVFLGVGPIVQLIVWFLGVGLIVLGVLAIRRK